MISDEMKEQLGLFDVCEWLVETYPEDIFIGGSSEGATLVAEMRDKAKRILQIHKETL